MKPIASLVLLVGFLTSNVDAQTERESIAKQSDQFQISPELAQKLLIHKADLTCPSTGMPAHVTGTVVVDIQIGKNGDVLFAKVISGPAMLRKQARDSVRKYKYKPYLLNSHAVSVETTVSVAMDSYRDCPSK
jgi:outer membrane biosynthesis protein TonB